MVVKISIIGYLRLLDKRENGKQQFKKHNSQINYLQEGNKPNEYLIVVNNGNDNLRLLEASDSSLHLWCFKYLTFHDIIYFIKSWHKVHIVYSINEARFNN